MGVLPLPFDPDQSWKSLELTGHESYYIKGVSKIASPKEKLTVTAKGDTKELMFNVTAQIDNGVELDYYKSGGVLPYVFRKLSAALAE
jgi:aconitate hydratase